MESSFASREVRSGDEGGESAFLPRRRRRSRKRISATMRTKKIMDPAAMPTAAPATVVLLAVTVVAVVVIPPDPDPGFVDPVSTLAPGISAEVVSEPPLLRPAATVGRESAAAVKEVRRVDCEASFGVDDVAGNVEDNFELDTEALAERAVETDLEEAEELDCVALADVALAEVVPSTVLLAELEELNCDADEIEADPVAEEESELPVAVV